MATSVKARRTEISLWYNSTPISEEVGPDVESITYTDCASDTCDSVDIQIDARDGKWLNSWFPKKGATLHPKVNGLDWNVQNDRFTMDCGLFVLDDVQYGDAPGTMTLGGVSTNTDGQVLDVDGAVIPGLYAAGECVGGIWGRFVSGGTGVMGPIVFGRLAARAAMATEPATGYTLKTPAAVITEDMFAKDADGAESLFDMSQPLADGEYEATVDGQEGPMTVKVTVADGKIAAVVVAENHETQAVAAAALEKVPQAIVDANSVDVDGVSGATLTSGRIKDAAVKCLTQAAQ